MTAGADAFVKALFPHVAETRDLIVRVAVSYLPEESFPDHGQWTWAYHIRIENDAKRAVQLLARHWIIVDGHGRHQEVEGPGVVGEQPVIEPGGSFDYVSSCRLATPIGSMEGSYHMAAADGSMFQARIPRFPLTAPGAAL